MKSVNALAIRNKLGEILDGLDQDGEPVVVTKGRKVRAVLITPEDFKTRFLDKQAEEYRQKLLDNIAKLRAGKREDISSLEILREMRGYSS